MINESVAIIAQRFGCLNEMFVEGKRNLVDGAHILAYRSKIWVLKPEVDLDEASKRLQASIRKETMLKRDKYTQGMNEPIEERPDILRAIYRNVNNSPQLVVEPGMNFQHDPQLSLLVKKVAQTLGVKSVVRGDKSGGVETYHSTSELKAGTPTEAYHGTSTRWLSNILHLGIAPHPEQTNFDNIKHEDHIFLTTSLDKAVFHAGRASTFTTTGNTRYSQPRVQTNENGETPYQPVILKVKIPDPALLDADYDIDRESGQKTYGKVLRNSPNEARDKNKIPGDAKKVSKALGIFGYKGKILPQHIVSIMIGSRFDPNSPPEDEEGTENYQTFSPDEVRKSLKLAEEHGIELDYVDLKDFIRMPGEFIQAEEDEEDPDAE